MDQCGAVGPKTWAGVIATHIDAAQKGRLISSEISTQSRHMLEEQQHSMADVIQWFLFDARNIRA